MKILSLNLDDGIPVLGSKGASVHVRAFASALVALGHDVVLVCSRLGAGEARPAARIIELAPEVSAARLEPEWRAVGRSGERGDDFVLGRELTRLAHDRALPQRILAALGEIRFCPDLIHERQALFYRAGAVLAGIVGAPRLLEVNAPLVEESRRFRKLRLEDAARAREAESYRGAAAILAVSDGVARHVRAVLGEGAPVTVVPNGVDLACFGGRAGGAAIRARFGLGTALVIGFVGSFKPWHGALFLLEVFRRLAERRCDLRLLAVGEGPELAEMRARAKAYRLDERVILPGRVAHDEIPEWFAAMDLTVAPYLPQPDFYFSPLKIVESLAAGRPVIAPRLGQIGQLVEHGVAGLLYPPGDAAACTGAIEVLLDRPALRRRMGEAAWLGAGAYGWEGVARRALGLVRQGAPPARRLA